MKNENQPVFMTRPASEFAATSFARIDLLLHELEVYDATSQEALNANVFGRAFVSVADTFTGILRTFRTNILKFPKSLKRSELKEFIDSNGMKVKTVNGFTFDQVMKQKVCAPSALKVTYVTACESILNAYNKLNAINLAKLTDTTLTNIYKSMSREDKQTGALIKSASTVISNTVSAAAPVVAVCQKDFSGNAEGQIDFSVAFKTMEEFRRAQSALLDMEARLQDVAVLTESVNHIESTLQSICSIISANEEILQKEDVMFLGSVAKGLALIFEAYSMAASRQMALEHNTVININNLYDKVK